MINKKNSMNDDFYGHANIVDECIIRGFKLSSQEIDFSAADNKKEFIVANIKSNSRRVEADFSRSIELNVKNVSKLLMGYAPDKVYFEIQSRFSSNMIFHQYYVDFKLNKKIDPNELIEIIFSCVESDCENFLVFFGASLSVRISNKKIADLIIGVVTNDSL